VLPVKMLNKLKTKHQKTDNKLNLAKQIYRFNHPLSLYKSNPFCSLRSSFVHVKTATEKI